MVIKQLASFSVINVNGGSRVTYTYDKIDSETGDLISGSVKESFYAVDPELVKMINEVRNYISEHKLTEE